MSDNKLHLDNVRQAAEQTADPLAIVSAALANLHKDRGAMYEDHVLDALRTIRKKDEAEYVRLTTKAKGCKTQLDKLTRPEGDSGQDSNQDQLVELVRSQCQFFHTADERGFVTMEVAGHREVYFLESTGFKSRLRALAYQVLKVGISDQAMNTILATLQAIALHEGPEAEVHFRCAKVGNAYYIDLCNDKWQVVRVNADGYTCVDVSPVYFVRTKTMRALPTPLAAGTGNFSLFWNHVNVPTDSQLMLMAWLLDSLRPDTPNPVAELTGPQGAAKSSTQRRARSLIDPSESPLRASPKTVEDIYVAAGNSYMLSYENLSKLTPDQQDAFCTVATGGSYSTRQLYTNGEEFVLNAKAPIILNGINPVATRGDLIERAVSIELPTIPPEKRRDEQLLEATWQEEYPLIFTGLLNLFSQALRALPDVTIPNGMQKRMIDYQKLGEAVAVNLGYPHGEFSRMLDVAQGDGVLRMLDSYGIAVPLQAMVDASKKPWTGNYLELLHDLNDRQRFDRVNWPKSPSHLAYQIKRIAPGLLRVGVNVEFLTRNNKGAQLLISKLKK